MSDFNFAACANCLYNAYFADKVTAECHRSPPAADSAFPELAAGDWCGEYKQGTAYQQAEPVTK